MTYHTNSYDPVKHQKTLIAEINDCKLFRIDPAGCWEGDFYFEVDGEFGFIDTSYKREDEDNLVVEFIEDYKNA